MHLPQPQLPLWIFKQPTPNILEYKQPSIFGRTMLYVFIAFGSFRKTCIWLNCAPGYIDGCPPLRCSRGGSQISSNAFAFRPIVHSSDGD